MSLSEILFLGVLGLVVFGPGKLAEVGQLAGKTLARLKKVSDDFQFQLQTEIAPTANRPLAQKPVVTGLAEAGNRQGLVGGSDHS